MKQLLKNPLGLNIRQCLATILLTFVFTLGLIATPANATGVYNLPSQPTWVVDQAEVISRINEGKLKSNLENLAQETGVQVRVVALRRLEYGETIDSLTQELFTTWFPTPESQANQVILAIDTLTNTAAMRSGEGTKDLLSEEITASVVEESVGIPLREGSKYNEAFLEASNRLAAVLSGQPDPGPPVAQDTINIEATYVSAEDTDDKSAAIWVIVLLIVATIIPMATYFWYVGFN